MKTPLAVVIAGPTASGKTALAIKLAMALKTEVISADSRQLYQEFSIGVARPSEDELKMVPHHFIATESINHRLSAGDYAQKAKKTLNDLLDQYNTAVVVGGSGLYIKALLEGFDSMQDTPKHIRDEVNELFAVGGLQAILAKIVELSPSSLSFIDAKNPARAKRCLELIINESKSLEEIWVGQIHKPEFTVLGFYLNPSKAELYDRINQRVDLMIQNGLENEAKQLFKHPSMQAMPTVGYSEFDDYFIGKQSLEKSIELLKQHTRNYAKRQLTWFKNKTTYIPLSPETALTRIFETLKSHGYTIHQ